MKHDNMVFLTMTASMVEALEMVQSSRARHRSETQAAREQRTASTENESMTVLNAHQISTDKKAGSQSIDPVLENPKIGNPILHGQVVDLWKQMKEQGMQPSQLETLLKGSRIYIPPPPPKPEPTQEYKALMARLRREEEERAYERMTNPTPPAETFAQRFPMASAAHAFPSSYQNIEKSDPDDDGTTYADIDRQMALIFNVLISIVACAAAIWIAARWWSTPMRLALSMSGSLLVGVAEVVVYSGYIRRVGEAKMQEKKVKEVKEIMNTWVVGVDDKKPEQVDPVTLKPKKDDEEAKARRRKKNVI